MGEGFTAVHQSFTNCTDAFKSLPVMTTYVCNLILMSQKYLQSQTASQPPQKGH